MLLLLAIFSALFSTILGIFVVLRNRKSALHIIFCVLSFAVGFWSIINYLTVTIQDESVLIWIRLVMSLAVIQSISFLLFIQTFPSTKISISRKKLITIISSGLLATVLTQTKFVFSSVIFESGQPSPQVAPGILVFIIVAIGSLLWGFVTMILKHRNAIGIQKKQLRYILFGFILLFVLILIFNFVLVVIFENSSFIKMSPSFALPFIGFTAYSIIRYRLLDIRLVITRSIIYFFLILFVTLTFTVIAFLAGSFFGESVSPLTRIIVTSVIIVFTLDPLKAFIGRLTDAIFYKGAIDYDLAAKNLADITNREIELQKLVKTIDEGIARELKVKGSHVLLLEPTSKSFVTSASIDRPMMISGEVRVRKLLPDGNTVMFDELERRVIEEKDAKKKKEKQYLFETMDRLSLASLTPLRVEDRLIGLLATEAKLSGDVFSRDDISLLGLVATQLSTAIEKAKLFEEVKNFTEKLKVEVENATRDLATANTQLAGANDRLKILDEAKNDFISIASHQLRTPLSGIVGYLDMMVSGDFGVIKPNVKKVMDQLLAASKRLVRLVNVFLNVSKIESGRLSIERRPGSHIEDFIDREIAELTTLAADKNIKLIFKRPKPPLPPIALDDKMGDVVLNLIDNAIKYTEAGSVTVTAELDGDAIVVRTKDTGIGIEPQAAKKLFDKFVRGEGVARIQPDGSGLGLYIAKRIVEAHAGKIWVESEGVGKGSSFIFRLPLNPNLPGKNEKI